ncbi:MAG TPA: hypothetical protein VK716_11205 [Terracidiphilus sp.]|nr:hypothetical protein [Terracidiphilus sp.]
MGFQPDRQSILHADPPRPLLLWIHGAAFSGWVAFYIVQSGLVRTRNVQWHRFLGWFGLALGIAMVGLGFAVSIIMGNFDAVVLHLPSPTFLSVPWFDMTAFGTCLGLAIYWRKKPELHRRLLFLASCSLLDAPFGRFSFLFNNNLFFPCLDVIMLLGVGRDLFVDRRIHKAYRVALPLLFAGQALAVYLYAAAPAWWLGFTRSVLGI